MGSGAQGLEASGVPELRGTADLRIGSLDGADDVTFVGEVLVAPDGSMLLADHLEGIRVLDETGEPLHTIGGPGDGPGEFRSPDHLGWLGDTLWVGDTSLGRQTLFDFRDGTVLDTRRVTSGSGLARLLEGGRAVATPATVGAIQRAGAPVEPVPLLLMTYDGSPLDTVGAVSSGSVVTVRHSRGAMHLYRVQAFHDGPLWAVAPGGDGVVSVWRSVPADGSAAALRVRSTSSDGARRFERDVPYQPESITEERISAAVQWILYIYPRLEGNFGSRAEAEAAVRAALTIPEYHPPVISLVVGNDGTTWLRRDGLAPDGEAEWVVLDESGEIIARVLLPAADRIVAAERWTVWTRRVEESGLYVIVRYNLT